MNAVTMTCKQFLYDMQAVSMTWKQSLWHAGGLYYDMQVVTMTCKQPLLWHASGFHDMQAASTMACKRSPWHASSLYYGMQAVSMTCKQPLLWHASGGGGGAGPPLPPQYLCHCIESHRDCLHVTAYHSDTCMSYRHRAPCMSWRLLACHSRGCLHVMETPTFWGGGGGAVPPHFFEGLDNLTLQNKKRELQASNLLPLWNASLISLTCEFYFLFCNVICQLV